MSTGNQTMLHFLCCCSSLFLHLSFWEEEEEKLEACTFSGGTGPEFTAALPLFSEPSEPSSSTPLAVTAPHSGLHSPASALPCSPPHTRCCRALRLSYSWQCVLQQETSSPPATSILPGTSPLHSSPGSQPPAPLNSPHRPWGTPTVSLLVPG